MDIRRRFARYAALTVALALSVGCAAPASGPTGGTQPQPPAAPKRITATILGEPIGVGFAEFAVPAGKQDLEGILNAGLTVRDPQEVRQPRLADAVPSIENGLWKLSSDGTMETTWRLRPNIVWHDGAPFTTDDLLFTTSMEQDKEAGIPANPLYASIARIEALDASTVRVTWSKTYLWADSVFAVGEPGPYAQVGAPRPRHLLEKPYLENKANLTNLPFWNVEFVGTGPYKLGDWVKGSHINLLANDHYVLGRPKVDEIDVRFIADQNVLVSGFLAGAYDLTLSRGFTLEQGILLRDQWTDGQVLLSAANPILMYPQLLPPAPAAMGDVRFRRALLYAADRQQMVDTLMHGLSQVAHAPYLLPGSADYAAIENQIVRYDYDPQTAAQLLANMGLTKGADGFVRYASGDKPVVEINANDSNFIQPPAMAAVADYWQRAGVTTQTVQMTTAEMLRNPEYLATRPAFYLARRPVDYTDMHSAAIPTAENRFVGLNLARYQNPEADALIDRYKATIPRAERSQLIGQVVHFLTDQAVMIGLFYDDAITAFAKRLKNVTGTTNSSGEVWNAHEWELRS